MFRFKDKVRFLALERVWFTENTVNSEADIIRYLRCRKPRHGLFIDNRPVETVLSDISEDTDTILSKCTKTVKYEVNKCSKEDISINFYTAGELGNNTTLVDEFEKAYIDFATGLEDKSVLAAYNRHKIENMTENDCILISKAEKDSIAVYHVYAWGDGSACLLFSVSNFRNDPSLRNLAGRMNKLLHIRDIEWFREKGVSLYDWGNISSSVNPNGIDKFKMSFGGEVTTVYNALVGNSALGKFVSLMYRLKHSIL